MFGNTSSGAPPATAIRHNPGSTGPASWMTLRLSCVQSNAFTARSNVSWVGSPTTCNCSSFCRKTLPPRARVVQANEREISAVRRNHRVNVAEIRGRTRQLPLLTILQRVQIDRGRGKIMEAAPSAEDQVLAVRRPRKPTRPNPMSASRHTPARPRTAAARDRRAPALTRITRFPSRTRTNAMR